jgi:DNA-binding IclR family transcriptional regulator
MDKTVVKALAVIETLARHDAPAGVTHLAEELGMTKSNVFRLLNTLAAQGYVKQDPVSGKYDLTLKLWHLGTTVHSRLDLKNIAAPYLQELMESTRESVHLSVFEEGEVIYVDKVESDQPVRAYSRVGDRPPCHSVATGKALLAFLPGDVLEKVFQKGLAKYTSHTITSVPNLRKELETIRRDGYSVNRGEWREGVCGVAAPIRNSSGEVIAAVGISGPSERFKGKQLAFAPPVIQCANTISQALGMQNAPTAPSRYVKKPTG